MVRHIRKTKLALSRQNSRSFYKNLPDQENLYWIIDCKRMQLVGTIKMYFADYPKNAHLEFLPQTRTAYIFLYTENVSRYQVKS